MNSTGRQQSVDAPLTRSATFLVLAAEPGQAALDTIRSTLSGVEGLTKNVAIRDLNSQFTCTVGIGSGIWDSLTRLPRPTELRPLPVLQGAVHATVSTPGDLLFHIRSNRRDLCFEFERQLLNQLGKSVRVVDATVGFRYFDTRDLLGRSQWQPRRQLFMVQKYVHNSMHGDPSRPRTRAVIGRTKIDNIELDDAESGQRSHKTLTTIEDENGKEHGIVRDNMPFGSPASGEYGTYFIGYSKQLWVMERMLERMFIGHPPGKHDRILDFSTPVTGSTFFAPSVEVLAGLDD
ncbi:hypothetical protein NEMBOFW57_004010 [Staphylotrichum longicolle]|uniref:Dyp-type peroxidase n=1 Tax=Staphylotrichum longicolle TaxID=669026 RepID=A0AAD4F751_9PEZI|nr:hypothetical protein NEMBOFW57_004010 [Staphylotrichum longicolle]